MHYLENAKALLLGYGTLSLQLLTHKPMLACQDHRVPIMRDLCDDPWDLRTKESRVGTPTFLMGSDLAGSSSPALVEETMAEVI